MFSSYITLDDVSIFEAAELDAVALLADIWDYDLDPEVSAQLVPAHVRGSFSFGKQKGRSKGKGKFPVRSSRLPVSDRRQQLKELRERTECYACGTTRLRIDSVSINLFPEPQTRTVAI